MKTTALLLLLTASIVAVTTSSADTISWTRWSTNTAGNITHPAISVTYSGELQPLQSNYPSWTPSTTFADGNVVGNPPPQSGNMIILHGGDATVDTITFSPPVVDPVFSIWSLGDGNIQAKFEFINATPTVVAGGESAEYHGGPIMVVWRDTVLGSEGNGTIRFSGTYSSISWKNTVREDYYGFTVGVKSDEPGVQPQPLPHIDEVGPTVEWKCFASVAEVCIDNRPIRTCVGGNPNYCWDIPQTGGGPGCIRCLLGASAAVGAALGVGGATLWVRRRRV